MRKFTSSATVGPVGPEMDNDQRQSVDEASEFFIGSGPWLKEKTKPTWKTLYIDFRALAHYAGPGLLMSLALIDPGNITSDLQSGAYTGFKLGWVMLYGTLFAMYVQNCASKLGIVTGVGLAEHCSKEFNKCTNMVLWVGMELAIIGSDIQKIIVSAVAIQILTGLTLWAGCFFALLDTFLYAALKYGGATILEIVLVVIIGTMCICFWIISVQSDPQWGEVVKDLFVPEIPSYSAVTIVGSLGSVTSPYNIFMNSYQVTLVPVDRERAKIDNRHIRELTKYNYIESSISLFMALLINLAVTIPFAVYYFYPECARAPSGPFARLPFELNSTECAYTIPDQNICCGEIGLADVVSTFDDHIGQTGQYIFAIGLLGSGQASTLSIVTSGQALIQGFYNKNIDMLERQTFMRGLSFVPAVLITLSPGTPDIFVQWLNILQGILLPLALLPLAYFLSKHDVMGTKFVSGKVKTAVLWTIIAIMIGINFWPVFELAIPIVSKVWPLLLVISLFLAFMVLVAYFVRFQLQVFWGPSENSEVTIEQADIEEQRQRDTFQTSTNKELLSLELSSSSSGST
mmetsp:Transcript_18220/g.29631  ORF Transcript_18220/g.29631 Transcript_18220/m.29631 type:complete len:573 (-) Transcript_18220:462-2180(-)|eukprot:CAMPEP_0203744208 /NCGR_PEP_ID=MMETSP0098-20131031/360_1 /ASSEMBLY_ACC=CAM_ASM_000208 /TAXON_ID=96639 /ORGANISM=" , Strain NY0313808BC1" /LENGTH=572 /DNA_ID=CAMNT_0050631669 /DNA_START=223 /DNA_END=1941 /DNA_ORIENTATION=-